jgi:Fic family protein
VKKQYIWQKQDWPHFKWSSDELLSTLGQVRKLQGQLLLMASSLGLDAQARIFIDEAVTTSGIEGEKLDRDSVRSSVARRLGLPSAGLTTQQRQIDGLVDTLLDATRGWNKELTSQRLRGWQASLFPTGYSSIHKVTVGKWRKGDEPMQVISGRAKEFIVHYVAPPSEVVSAEMKQFLSWWKSSEQKIDGLLRAGIAHFYFVTIHPFDDGNGRIARALIDMALAQDEKIGIRLYSLSSQILKKRNEYYEILETSQKGSCDITTWLKWFLEVLYEAMLSGQGVIQKTLMISEFWQQHGELDLNPRQRKVLQRLIDAEPEGFKGGMTNKKYISLAKTSRETAKRDLSDLERKGLIQRNDGQGRSISYSLVKELQK